jgi:hypothetical protein
VSILFSGCLEKDARMKGSRLYITGDSQAIGADIFIDGKKVGIMEKYVYAGPQPSAEEIKKQHEAQQRLGMKLTNPPKPGDVFAVGVDLRISSGEKKPEYGIYSDIRVSLGKHELLFINKEGKQLKKEIKIQGENYIAVDFEKMVIQGGD